LRYGRPEKLLNQCYNRLLAPAEVFVESGRIVFMAENQAVVYWAVKGTSENDNPVVEQGSFTIRQLT
jgi:hypothetical protein